MHDCKSNLVGIPDGQGKLVRIICRSSRAASLVKRALITCSEGKGIIGAEVLSLSSFLSERARELGLESQIVGSMGREMKLQLILERKRDWFLESKEPLSQYVADFNNAISLLKTYGISASQIEGAASHDDEKRALSSAFKEYDTWLQSSGYLDVEDLWERICKSGKANDEYLNIAVGFTGDWIAERKLASLKVSNISADRLIKIDKKEEGNMPLLTTLKARQGMQLAREVARMIKQRHTQASVDYSEFCVCIPRSAKASQEVAAAMDWAGIPCTEPVWMNLADHPIGHSLLMLCELISVREQKLDAFRYVRNPYFGIADSDMVSLLKGKLRTKGQLMKLRKWAEHEKYGRYFHMREPDPNYDVFSLALNELKIWSEKMLAVCEEMSSRGTWDVMAGRFLRYLDEELKFLNDESSHPALRAIEEKALAGLKDILSKIVEAGKLISQDGAEVGWPEFSYTLVEALQKKRILVKGASPLGVAVAELSDVEGLSFDTTVIYEPTEAYCPNAEKPSWLLREDELPFFDVSVRVPTREQAIKQERELFMAAADTARLSLILALPSIGSDERQINKSVWVDDLIEEKSKSFNIRLIEVLRKLPSPSRLEDCITKNEISLSSLDEIIYRGSEPYGFKAAWENDLSKKEMLRELSRRIIGEEHVWSASRINKFLKCSLSALPDFLLNIRDKQEYEESLTRLGKGNLAHDALKEAIGVLVRLRQEGKLTAAEAAEMAKSTAEYAMSYDKAFKYADSSEQVWNLMVDGIKEAVKRFLDEEAAYLWDEDSGRMFEPVHLERLFPIDADAQELDLGSRTIRYSAKVDRIDKVMDGKEASCIVYDYKTGELPKPGNDCQVAFYSVICDQVLSMKPVASLYLAVKLNKDSKTMRNTSRRGVFLNKYLKALGFNRVNHKDGDALEKTSLLRLDSNDPEEIVRISEHLLEDYVRNITDGQFLDHVEVDEWKCRYCSLRSFCSPLRLGAGEEEAVSE